MGQKLDLYKNEMRVWLRRAGPSCPKRKTPRRREFQRRVVVNDLREDRHSAQQLCACYWGAVN